MKFGQFFSENGPLFIWKGGILKINFWKNFGKFGVFIYMKFIITERQSKILVEGIPVEIRRRITHDRIKFNIDEVVKDFNRSMCKIPIDDYIHQVCHMTVGDIFYTYEDESGDKEIHQYANEFHSYVMELFEEYLREKYINRCR